MVPEDAGVKSTSGFLIFDLGFLISAPQRSRRDQQSTITNQKSKIKNRNED
jgi:hypothetical protein